MSHLPRATSKKFKVLEFIGSRDGTRYSEIERFICELAGYDYDLKVPVRRWDCRTGQLKDAVQRRWKGIWGTNLCYGKDAILHKYCVKGADRKWRLKIFIAKDFHNLYQARNESRHVYYNPDPLFPIIPKYQHGIIIIHSLPILDAGWCYFQPIRYLYYQGLT